MYCPGVTKPWTLATSRQSAMRRSRKSDWTTYPDCNGSRSLTTPFPSGMWSCRNCVASHGAEHLVEMGASEVLFGYMFMTRVPVSSGNALSFHAHFVSFEPAWPTRLMIWNTYFNDLGSYPYLVFLLFPIVERKCLPPLAANKLYNQVQLKWIVWVYILAVQV